jgi:hypothetical protein
VIVKEADGTLGWSTVSSMVSGDSLGSHIATKTVDMNGNILDANYVTASSITSAGALIVYGTSTLTGNVGMGGALAVTGNTSLNGLISLGDGIGDLVTIAGPVTSVSSLTVLGAFEADGNIVLGNAAADLLTMNAQASFLAGSTFSAGAYFTGLSSFSSVVSINTLGSVRVNDGTLNQVVIRDADGTLGWGTVSAMVAGDNLGSHIATMTITANNGIVGSTATFSGFVMASSFTAAGNIGVGGALVVSSSGTFTQGVTASSFTALNNTQFGNAYTDLHGVNTAPMSGTALTVAGTATTGDFAAKFYSGATLSAWIKKK